MNREAIVASAEPETQIMPDPIEESEGRGVVRLASQQNPRDFVTTQMRKERSLGITLELETGIRVFERRADEVDHFAGVLGIGEQVIEGT